MGSVPRLEEPACAATSRRKRRGRDSNPRGRSTRPNGFQDRRIQPLCHPSVEPRGLAREVSPRAASVVELRSPSVPDWVTISSLATAGGTLVLAGATFSAVRSSNRSARIAEQALQEQRRPLLVNARLDDPLQKAMFANGHWVRAEGSQAVVEEDDGTLYLALPVRNAGSGIAVLQGWHPWPELVRADVDHPPPER